MKRLTRIGPLPLSAAHWRSITAAIGPDIAHNVKLPGGHSLRDGFRVAIWDEIKRRTLPSGHKVHKEVRGFLESFAEDFNRLSRPAQMHISEIFDPVLARDAAKRIGQEMREETADEPGAETFLVDIVWLARQCGVPLTLPAKLYLDDAPNYPAYRIARAVVAAALAIAERHEPAAVPALRHMHEREPSTVVSHLSRARREASLLQVSLDEGQFLISKT